MTDMIEMVQGYINYFIRKPAAFPRTIAGVFDRVILRKPHLRVAEVATTFLCNSKCIMCSCSEYCNTEKEKQRLTPEEYEKLAAELDDIGCVSVNITGGEALVRKDIDAVIKAFNPSNKIVNLITNGILLDKEKIKYYASLGIDSIVVSLESTNAEENDRIRGYNGHFTKVMDIISWTSEFNMKLGISLTIGDFNFDKVYEMLEFCKSRKVFLCLAHGGSVGKWSKNTSIYLSETNARKLLKLIKQHKEMKIDFSANLDLKPGCPAILEKIYVTPYGDILPCTFIPLSFGNLREEPFKVIWERMIKFHRENVTCRTYCLRSYNRDFITKFLEPVKPLPRPVCIKDHPYFKETGKKNVKSE